MFPSTPRRGNPAAGASASSNFSREPDVIDTLLDDIRSLRAGMHRLVVLVSRPPMAQPGPGWSILHREIVAARSRVESLLQAAAAQERLRLGPVPAASGSAWEENASILGRCRRLARDLEEQCAAASSLAAELGLEAAATALQRCRCELIGLERPLIAAHADESHRAAS